ncbi:hypothetical protein MRB53_034890 [Persea americana]|uniref:Uncharacterized protein n=1 Tax=Persea americana TaxID=3435 RepID=A0ACC2K329_PERAE|nr:hypothetical protein MRB53_034890 [Persea americana]
MCSLDSFTAHEDAKDAWDFLVDLAEKTREWESTQENERSHGGKGFYVEGLVAKEAHLDSLIKRLEVLVTKEPDPVHQVSQVPMCNWCQSPGHVMEECPNTSGGNNHENLPPGFTNTGEAARISELEKSMTLLMSSHNTVERQLSQIVTLLHEKEKGTLPSQPETNPRHQAQIQQGTPPRLNQIPNPQCPGPSGDCHMISALRSGREYQQANVPHSSPVDTPVAPIPVKASSEPPPLGVYGGVGR